MAIDGDLDGGGRRTRRGATSSVLPTTRSSRSHAAATNEQETPMRPTRSGRSSRQVANVASSSSFAEVGEEQDEDEDGGEEEEDEQDDDEDEDDQKAGGDYEEEEEDEDEFVGRSVRGSQRSPRKRGAAHLDDDDSAPSPRASRQRSSGNLRSVASPVRSSRTARISRASKAKESSGIEHDEDEDIKMQLDDDEEESGQEVPQSRGKRIVHLKTNSSPAKASVVDAGVREEDSLDPQQSTGARQKSRSSDEADGGWIEEIDDKEEARRVYTTILSKIRTWLTQRSIPTLTSFLEREPSNRDDRYMRAVTRPVTLQSIEKRIQSSGYASSIDFERDMLQLFRNGRRYFEPGSDAYGGVMTLQRMYHHITQSVDAVQEPVEDDVVKRNYASIQYGPCQEPEGQGAGEMPCVGEIVVVPKHVYKGNTYSVGMWVHLSNPTDPARPIIAQIFKTRTEDLEDRRQDWISACWFLRPEQSRHPRSMMFWEDEVIKTSQMVEHHVEDILEVVCVNFYTKASRGTPADGEGGWRVGDPLYICENRYQAQQDAFFKIKNWASCLPEETRYKKFHLVEYDQPITLPEKLNSPFLRGVDGPGEIVKESRPVGTLSAAVPRIRVQRDVPNETGAIGRPGEDFEVPLLFKEWRNEVQVQRKAMLRARAEQRAAASEKSGIANGQASPSAIAQPSQQASVHAGSPTAVGNPATAVTSTSPRLPASSSTPSSTRMPPFAEAVDRSLLNALSQTDVNAYFEMLPEATQQLFHQDAETGKTVWYPAPPIVGPTEASMQQRWNKGERFQAHSLDYLYYLATNRASQKQKRKHAQDTGQESSSTTTTSEKASESTSHTVLSAFDGQTSHVDLGSGKWIAKELDNREAELTLNLLSAFSEAIQNAANTLSQYVSVQQDDG